MTEEQGLESDAKGAAGGGELVGLVGRCGSEAERGGGRVGGGDPAWGEIVVAVPYAPEADVLVAAGRGDQQIRRRGGGVKDHVDGADPVLVSGEGGLKGEGGRGSCRGGGGKDLNRVARARDSKNVGIVRVGIERRQRKRERIEAWGRRYCLDKDQGRRLGVWVKGPDLDGGIRCASGNEAAAAC